MSNHWEIDKIQSQKIGSALRGVTIYSVPYPLKTDRIWQIWFELVFVSICHQTNWNKLHDRVIEIASNNPEALHPYGLYEMDIHGFYELFGKWLDADGIRASERLAILNSLGRQLKDWTTRDDLKWLKKDIVTLSNPDGIYAWLDKIEVFVEDPVRKKARVFVHQLLHYNLVKIADPDNIAPAIDHHIIRLYIRTGRVIPKDPELLAQLAVKSSLDSEFVTDLRYLVEKAMWYSAAEAGLRMDIFNYIEWQIARSFCITKAARCQSMPLPEKPVDSAVLCLSNTVGGGCPIRSICHGVRTSELRKVIISHSDKSYY